VGSKVAQKGRVSEVCRPAELWRHTSETGPGLEALRALSPFLPPQDGVGSPPETRSIRFSTLTRSGGKAYDGTMLELSKSVRGERRVAS